MSITASNLQSAISNMGNTLLITGATGNIGAALVAELRRRGAAGRIVAAATDVATARAQLGDDIGYVRLDFRDPASYPAAFAGVGRLFLMRPPQIADIDRSIAPAIRAARAAGVRQVVFLSLIGVEGNPWLPHAQIEALLRGASMPWTMLRPSFFMQNLSTTHRDEIRDGEIFVPAGNGRTSFIDVRDIAAVAALALTKRGHEGRAYELTGSEALTYGEVAAALTESLGKPIRYCRPSLLAFLTRQLARGTPLPFALVMAGIYTTARLGLAARLTETVQTLLGRPPIALRQYIEDYREVWV